MSENQRDPQYKLRWSEELREKVAQSAKEHNRSMNADIVARLEQSFDQAEDCESKAELKAQISHLEGVIKGYDSAIKKLTNEFFNKKEP